VLQRLKISLKVNDFFLFYFSKGDHTRPKNGTDNAGFSNMEESFVLRNQIWKNGLPGLQKIG
jgi:hypothetical protein